VGANKYVYVVEIPKSPTAPHMAKDQRYYKRYNFQVLPMIEYEVRETMHRNIYPILKMHDPQIFPNEDGSFSLIFRVKNKGFSVAKYFDIILHFDKEIEFDISEEEEWKDLSDFKPQSKLRWAYDRFIHPDLRISTPAIKFLKVPGNFLHITVNLYAEKMERITYVCNIDISDIRNPVIEVEQKETTKKTSKN